MFRIPASRRRSARPRTIPALLSPFIVFGLGACATPAPAPIDPAATVHAVEARSAALGAAVEALSWTGLEGLELERPRPATPASPVDRSTWRAAVLAFNPEVRMARREVLTLEARRDGAGLPGKIGVDGELLAFDEDLESEVAATFDVLGLLGLGPSRAAKALADAATRAAYGKAEAAVWSAYWSIDAAVGAVALAHDRRARLEALLLEARADWGRADSLAAEGRISAGDLARARAIVLDVERMATMAERDLAEARQEIAIECGLAADDSLLQGIDSRWLEREDELAAIAPIPAAVDLVQRHPVPRAALLEYAVAEAELRAAAAEQWPELRIGPKLVFKPGETVPGVMGGLEIPFPGTADAAIRAALSERDGARERFEDAVVRLLAEAAGARARRDTALVERELAKRQVELTEESWRAARAKFSIEPMALEGWAMALEQRAQAVAALATARATVLREAARVNEYSGTGPEVKR